MTSFVLQYVYGYLPPETIIFFREWFRIGLHGLKYYYCSNTELNANSECLGE